MERFQNENVYKGEYSEGKAHGKGIYSWVNGEVYNGEWNSGF